MSLSTYYLEYGRHFARLRRRRAYAPTSNTASHDNHEKINSWVSFSLYGYGAPLGGPLGRQSSAINWSLLLPLVLIWLKFLLNKFSLNYRVCTLLAKTMIIIHFITKPRIFITRTCNSNSLTSEEKESSVQIDTVGCGRTWTKACVCSSKHVASQQQYY